jgi:hypothetical protein
MAGQGRLVTQTARSALFDQLRRYDEAAFVALANRGLLRRAQKDLEKEEPRLLEAASEHEVALEFAGHRIRFDARGPAHASCSCPASGVCQHILAAALALQKIAARNDTGQAPDQATSATADATGKPSELSALHAALVNIDTSVLVKHAGKAGYRWAWQFVSDLDGEPDAIQLSGERNLVIEFRQSRLRFRYVGGGPESVLTDAQLKNLEKYQVAVVLAYRRAHGLDIAPPAEPQSRGKSAPSLDLGKDHALPQDSETAQQASRARLRESTCQLLEECIDLGLAHLSSAMQERFSTLAVWAQGAEYYRLALLLRRLADHLGLILDRAGSADEHRLLDEMTLAYALVRALQSAERSGRRAVHLLGQARSAYESIGQMELLGLGAVPWRSPAGYLGLTLVLFRPEDQQFYACTDARPEVQRGFNPRARYKAPGPWSGLGAPEITTGRRVRLLKPQVNAQGRLSGSESVSAAVEPADDFVQRLPAITDFTALAERRQKSRHSLLAEPKPMQDWAVLQPARFGTPKFDVNRQTLVWPLYDSNDAVIVAELPYSDLNEHAIKRIEQIGSTDLPPNTRLVARVTSVAGQLRAEPLSLIYPGEARCVDALHFDEPKAQGMVSKWLSRMKAAAAQADGAEQVLPTAFRPTIDLVHHLRRLAERGVAAGVGGESIALSAQLRRLNRYGFSALPDVPEQWTVQPSDLLRINYVRLQYERLVGAEEDGS